ncbi:MAG TPA: hypothetical protein VMU41_14470 [Candidatus Binataceae bacterium]|nr:hypothetical protein [Candidatus Binataceae bacterium]
MNDSPSRKIPSGKRFDSWKEIAAFLRKDVRTVQRWEKNEGLPVHRKPHDKLSSVYAYESELEAWWNAGRHPNSPSKAFQGPEHRPAMIVLPLRNLSEDRDQDYFSDGMTEELISQLSRINPQQLGVIAHASAMKYKASTKSLKQITRDFGAEYALEGSVRRDGDRIRISVALIRAADQTHSWSAAYDRDLRQILDVQAEVAQAVAKEIFVKVTNGGRTPRQNNLVDPSAYNAYLRGRYFWNRRTSESITRAIGCFEAAIAHDSVYAPAHVGLADCYAMLSSIHVGVLAPTDAMPQVISAAGKALELDPMLAEAHATLGHARLWYEWDWTAAERSFTRALELNPSYASARQWSAGYLQTIDHTDECFHELDLALELDPLSLIARAALENALYLERRYDKAIGESIRTLELEPSFVLSYFNLGRAYTHKGMHREAIRALKHARQLSGESPAMMMQLGYAYALAGKRTEARKMLAMLEQIARERYVPAFYFAAISTGLGDLEHAIKWLRKAQEERCDYLIHLPKESAADPLRTDPRFDSIVPRPSVN